jgi:uncharacterized membrane protein HdeD (DUF308 family)
MRAMLAQGTAGGSSRSDESPVRRPAFWCGALLIVLGLSAAGFMARQEIRDTNALVLLLVLAGTVEAFAGILDHRAGGRTASLDILLGLGSIAAGALLSTPGWGSASALVYLLTIWLLARGLLDLVGSALMRSEIIRDARLIRGGADLILGTLSAVALLVISWWEILFGWPESSVGMIRTFAGLSVVAAGAYLVTESRVWRGRSAARRGQRP